MKKDQCSICGDNIEFIYDYPGLVCRECEKRAVNENGEMPQHDSSYDTGDNPVFIDGIRCWRRYKFGGLLTMKDEHDCDTILEFYEKHVTD